MPKIIWRYLTIQAFSAVQQEDAMIKQKTNLYPLMVQMHIGMGMALMDLIRNLILFQFCWNGGQPKETIHVLEVEKIIRAKVRKATGQIFQGKFRRPGFVLSGLQNLSDKNFIA